jgi:carboxymethylenebutenolidase
MLPGPVLPDSSGPEIAAMGEFISLMARDGHQFQAWLTAPAGAPHGAVVVVQEIFGVNAHIRSVADRFASEGYLAIAPALFDRVHRNVDMGYGPADFQQGFGYRKQVSDENALADIGAALAVVKHAGKAGVVGFCWGGYCAFLAACDLPVACAVAYYGGGIAQHLDKVPKRPIIYHYGEKDAHIPPADVAAVRAAQPDAPVYTYPADHAFNRDGNVAYEPASAKLAWQRTLDFLATHTG